MPATKKIDFKKELKEFYGASESEATLVVVPKMHFLMIDGKGDPNVLRDYQQAIEALYAASYTIKFTLKFAKKGPEYAIPPLETLWWMADGAAFNMNDKTQWRWTAMLMQPPHITNHDIASALKSARERKPNPALAQIRFETFDEGLCAQILHIGPYNKEEPTIAKMLALIAEQGYVFHGKHHEIYLNDPRRTRSSKWKTILRHPVKKK